MFFSSSVWGQRRDQELGVGDRGDTSPKGGEVLFYIHQITNWMALESREQPPGEVSFGARKEIDAENKTECQDT